MAIQKYTNGVELKVGQWVCFNGMTEGSFASKPSIIREIKKATAITEICHRIKKSEKID